MPQRPSEPSSRPNRGEAREALIAAGRRLFAERGYKATTTREIATEAGVSHALLRYHFSSKEGLRDAVDENVLGGFERAFASARDEGLESGTLAEAGRAAALMFGADEERRRYIRRVLVDGDERAAALLGRLVEGARREVDRLLAGPGAPPAEDRRWAPYQVLFLILGPLLLEPALEAVMGGDPFAPETLAERSAANQRLLRRGLFGPR
ncbi:AcrR family transcriptional regulator [Actinomadura luteofluorescens]|uniref:AcrR family transcriptional regulator n=1 Tax=Actinomadura luteofluorescens TaxID=46163 RepID=A0A7Y9JF11_9ACTN|nr:TetR/AcrR family transcriptional regulator [Actinomadura luteofluorescens]NYD46510.1 AcrR family transcriptional regulator [Actinomadura luteofluorescens]